MLSISWERASQIYTVANRAPESIPASLAAWCSYWRHQISNSRSPRRVAEKAITVSCVPELTIYIPQTGSLGCA
ncbi:hypothetical protein BOTBODRAFT_32672 [Botryobasidium botryosum FD-172 SS1]|uniref:Uncharacterized protein n=1 Tax=Botryobasidium botryosum (strain FD-172 SS1) TaxID=930990 RepID=A0A067MIH3_BOTB1|nr:hypothetical protein BOTBODRAFT_32672 [Botryobasidium botryosum FD-172 SS1]